MLSNILVWLVLALITAAFAWLTLRAFRARNALVKWIGGILSALLTVILGLISVVALVGLVKLYTPGGQPVQDLQVSGTAEQIARGEHLADAFCVECHSPTGQLPLIGGVDLGKDIPLPLGRFISVNLTPGGPIKNWSDGEVLRILREGVAPDGRRLIMMGGVRARYMSDEDLHAVIAYLRSQPAVDNPTPAQPDSPNLLGAIMLGLNLVPWEPPVTQAVAAPPKGPTPEYGQYMVGFQDCSVCHGPQLDGNPTSPLAPKGANLRVVKGWTAEQFISTLRTGVDPTGHQLSAQMPWRSVSRLDDVELTAIHAYLNTLP